MESDLHSTDTKPFIKTSNDHIEHNLHVYK